MELIQSKSLLAKLMATENIVVEQRNVRTACFDVKNRILTVPTLDSKISGYLYDLFLGHEVGHALYTPLDGLYKAKEEGIPQSVINVVEDSRIERKIKNKYPGIRSSFVRGYRELIEKDFFETKSIDLNDMNFIDRVNLFTKGGPTQGIVFTPTEKNLLTKIESTQTYDDVLAVAREVLEYLKEEKEAKKVELHPDDSGDNVMDDYGFGDSEDFDSIEDSEDGDFEKPLKSSGPSDEFDDNEDDSFESQGSYGGAGADRGIESDPISHTDESFRKNESKLFVSDVSRYYANIPSFDLNEAIVTYKVLWKRYDEDLAQRNNNTYGGIFTGYDIAGFQKLRVEAKKVVGYLAKEFEMRKNADQLKRASTAKTGELNMNKIYSYKFAEDIFKKITVLPGGKSHGLVMFIDWSGSMHGHLSNTIKQLINLTLFCRKVNIPYEVYAFTSEYDYLYQAKFKDGDLRTCPFKLMNVLSSKMSSSEFMKATSALIELGEYRSYKPRFFAMGGTPLNETIISAMKIVPEFQKQYKLQVVNTVFLTDGDGHSLNSVYYTNENGLETYGYGRDTDPTNYKVQKTLVLRDPITKEEVRCNSHRGRELTSHFIEILKSRTNCNIVGFYVLSGREFGREVWNIFPTSVNHDKLKAEFRKNKSILVTSSGYY